MYELFVLFLFIFILVFIKVAFDIKEAFVPEYFNHKTKSFD